MSMTDQEFDIWYWQKRAESSTALVVRIMDIVGDALKGTADERSSEWDVLPTGVALLVRQRDEARAVVEALKTPGPMKLATTKKESTCTECGEEIQEDEPLGAWSHVGFAFELTPPHAATPIRCGVCDEIVYEDQLVSDQDGRTIHYECSVDE